MSLALDSTWGVSKPHSVYVDEPQDRWGRLFRKKLEVRWKTP